MNNKMDCRDTQRQAAEQLVGVPTSYEAPTVTDLGNFRDVTLGDNSGGTDAAIASL